MDPDPLVIHTYGSSDPDPYQNVMDPQHRFTLHRTVLGSFSSRRFLNESYLARTADAEIQQAISCVAIIASLQARVVHIVDRSYLQVEKNRPVTHFHL